jgi:hypothetical protein
MVDCGSGRANETRLETITLVYGRKKEDILYLFCHHHSTTVEAATTTERRLMVLFLGGTRGLFHELLCTPHCLLHEPRVENVDKEYDVFSTRGVNSSYRVIYVEEQTSMA